MAFVITEFDYCWPDFSASVLHRVSLQSTYVPSTLADLLREHMIGSSDWLPLCRAHVTPKYLLVR